MLRSRESLGFPPLGTTLFNEKRLGLVFLGLYAIVSLIWGFAADAPWDDDCPTRFLNTRNAFHDPENFLSVWNRPLFVLIFALPAQLGKISVPVLMTLISTLGAWLLWRAVRDLKVPNAWLVIPLYTFQPFFFGTSRVALTEPLAAALICAGLFFLLRKKWLPYALMGGLLPLARLEMSMVLILWLLPMLKEKQWKYIFWMALPVILWNVAGGVITGDFNYVFNHTFGHDTGVNRYGQTTFIHYFRHYYYVTGPVVALLLSLGLILRMRNKNFHYWIDGQFWLGFLVYVLFSWKLSMGNAAGFLRNLIPLSPLVALIAMDGYNQAFAILSGTGYGKRINDLKRDRILLGASVLLVLAIAYKFFSNTLALHQIIEPFADYSIVAVMGGCIALAVIFRLVPQLRSHHSNGQLLALGLAVTGMGYTMIKETPNISNSVERQAVGTIAKFYRDSEFADRPTYANHGWFFWAADLNRYDPQFKTVTMANLEAAPLGATVVWDVHYATRLAGNVSPMYMLQHREFVELLRIGNPDRKECVILYEKVGPDAQQQEARSLAFSQANPKFLPAITARAYHLMLRGKFKEAVERFDLALATVKNDPDIWYGRGYCMMQTGYFTEAIGNLTNAVRLWNRFPTAWHHLGTSQAASGDMKSAMKSMNTSIIHNPGNDAVFYSRGSVRAAMRDYEGAVSDYTAAIHINPAHAAAYADRAAAYSLLGKLDLARADIAKAVTMLPNEPKVIFVQGRIEMQAGRKPEGCALMQRAVDLGLKEAAGFLAKNCGEAVDSVKTAPR